MHRFKDRDMVADIGRRGESQSAYEAGAGVLELFSVDPTEKEGSMQALAELIVQACGGEPKAAKPAKSTKPAKHEPVRA